MFRNLLKTVKSCETFLSNCVIQKRLAGHSKWQNIRHVKGAKDAERSAAFTKLGRMIRVAIQEGGSADEKKNLKLEQVIEQCKRINMPTATIQSVIKSSQNDKSQCKSYMLEINGPGSSIILCEVYTDKLHQTKQNIAAYLKKHKAKYTDGARHLFQEKGVIETEILPDSKSKSSDEIIEAATDHAIESGAEDVSIVDEEFLQFICGASNLKSVQNNLDNLKYNIVSASVEYIPLKLQALNDSDVELCNKLLEKLNAMQEVIRISTNIE